MAKNYKKRGYPGKELKKQRKEAGETTVFYSDYLDEHSEIKHRLDCENEVLRSKVRVLKSEVLILTWELQDNRETWKKNKKENVTLSKKLDKLKHHLASLNTQKETVLRKTKLSRIIKNIR